MEEIQVIKKVLDELKRSVLMNEEERFKQYEELVESVVSEDFDQYEEKILSQSWMSSVQQLRLLNRMRDD